MGGLLGGSFQRRRWIVSVCSVLLGKTGFFCAGWYNGRNFLANGWMVETGQMGRG